jgi:hypothetical protein
MAETYFEEDEEESFSPPSASRSWSDIGGGKRSDWTARRAATFLYHRGTQADSTSLKELFGITSENKIYAPVGEAFYIWTGVPHQIALLPFHHALDAAIETARREILALPEDWDDAASPRYDLATLDRAANVLNRMAAVALTRRSELQVPAISPASHGSIDLYWSLTHAHTLLINVPAEVGVAATYSGRKGTQNTTAGTLETQAGSVTHLTSWLIE